MPEVSPTEEGRVSVSEHAGTLAVNAASPVTAGPTFTSSMRLDGAGGCGGEKLT
jgi:hypothetical protein